MWLSYITSSQNKKKRQGTVSQKALFQNGTKIHWQVPTKREKVPLKIFYLFLERGERRKEQREGNIGVWGNPPIVCLTLPTGDLVCNPGMCPDWELNQQPFGPQAGAQSTKPHQPGTFFFLNINSSIYYRLACFKLWSSYWSFNYFSLLMTDFNVTKEVAL